MRDQQNIRLLWCVQLCNAHIAQQLQQLADSQTSSLTARHQTQTAFRSQPSASMQYDVSIDLFVQVCDAHIAQQLEQLADSQTSSSTAFLERMNECWQDHCSQMLTIRSIFLYLDRTYVISDASVRSIFDMGLQLFRTHLATHPQVLPQC